MPKDTWLRDMKDKLYKVTINLIESLPEKEIAEREDRIVGILVKNAVRLCQAKKRQAGNGASLAETSS